MLAGETFVRKDQEPAQRESATAQSWGHQACRWHLCDSVFQKIYEVLCSSCEKEWEKCDRNKSADTKVIEVRGRGNAPGDRAKVSCSPREACGGTGWRSPWGSSGCGLEEACGRAGSWQELETSPRSNRMSGKSCSPWETRTGAVHPWRMTLVAWTHVGAVTEEIYCKKGLHPVGGTPCLSGGRMWGGRSWRVGALPTVLSLLSQTHHDAPHEEGRAVRSDAVPGKKEGREKWF